MTIAPLPYLFACFFACFLTFQSFSSMMNLLRKLDQSLQIRAIPL